MHAGRKAARLKRRLKPRDLAIDETGLRDGVSVVIPSRNGIDLLQQLFPSLLRELSDVGSEVIVVDNGSTDDSASWLKSAHPEAVVLASPEALSFAAAVNRGIAHVRRRYTLLLNNDMVLEPGFFPALLDPFVRVPHLFCATAQIFFPEGKRREETGIAILRRDCAPDDFPVTCLMPDDGEDLTRVTYGSGGCSLFNTAKLRALGGMGEVFQPAYVEDLDLGWRGWTAGWPTVFSAGARVVHHHRSTTKRYFTEDQIRTAVERNYLRFLARSVAGPDLFLELWTRAITRLKILASRDDAWAVQVLEASRAAQSWVEPPVGPNALGYFREPRR